MVGGKVRVIPIPHPSALLLLYERKIAMQLETLGCSFYMALITESTPDDALDIRARLPDFSSG